MTRTILAILLHLSCIPVYSQYFTKEEGTALIHDLSNARGDSARIDLLVKVAEYHTISSYDHPSNFDTASLLIAQAEALNAKANLKLMSIQIMMAKSFLYRYSHRYDEGRRIILATIDLLKKDPHYNALGKAYYELSNYYDYDFKPNTVGVRVGYIEQAVAAFEKSGDINDLGNCYKVMSDLHHLVNEYDKAMKEIEISLKYYKLSHYKRLEGVYDMYGQLFYAHGDYKQALAYELMALKTANGNENAGFQICEIENNVGLTLYKMNDARAALPHFKNALLIAEKEGDNETIYGLTAHVVETYIALNQAREGLDFFKSIEAHVRRPNTDKFETQGYIYKTYLSLYTILGQYSEAKYYCDQLVIKSRMPGLDVFKLNGYYEEIIKYFIATKEVRGALRYLKANEALLDSINDDIGLSRNYALWFSLDTANGNYKSAVGKILRQKFINDTILNAARASELKKLEVQYESEKKENDIRLKDQTIKNLVQADSLRKTNLEQARLSRNLTFVASLLFLALGGILYNQYKLKRKANIAITSRNAQLSELVKEKEWLVKEVHHRVKNNLQMVISLLNIQTAYLDNDAAIAAIRDSQKRMQAMSLIHQKLYQSKNVSVINMRAYIEELTSYLKDIYHSASDIHFELEIEAVRLSVSQAVPVGLILNEIITNAIKYAFSHGDNGIIRVSLKAPDPAHLQLTVSDNGKGLPDNFNIFESNSLGMNLVTGLVRQLEGNLRFENEGGVKIIIVFPHDGDRSNEDSGNFGV